MFLLILIDSINFLLLLFNMCRGALHAFSG